jgi:hypothetical protein
MNRSPAGSSAAQPKAPRQRSSDIAQEFCTRALERLALLYEGPSAEVVAPWPAAKRGGPPAAEKPAAFNSAVADLRLRRAQEPRAEAEIALGRQFAARAEEISRILRASTVSIDAAFAPEPGARGSKQALQATPEREPGARRPRRTPLQPVSVQENLGRLAQAKEIGAERARRRKETTARSGGGVYRVPAAAQPAIGADLAEERRQAVARSSLRRNYKSPTIARSG